MPERAPPASKSARIVQSSDASRRWQPQFGQRARTAVAAHVGGGSPTSPSRGLGFMQPRFTHDFGIGAYQPSNCEGFPLIARGLRRLVQQSGLAPKPKTVAVGPVNDTLENEARRVADHVMAGGSSSTAITPGALRISRMCSSCADETLQREPAGGRGVGAAAPPIVADVVSSPGQRLDRGTRMFFESRFGRDFGGVRIHTDAQAAESANSVNARAYTFGSHVVFGPGMYSPVTDAGRRLIAHELTHVVQQSGSERRVQRDDKDKQKNDKTQPPKEDPVRKEAMAQVIAIETSWKRLKTISSGFPETKGWISMGDKVVGLIREHSTLYLDASAAGDKELVNDYLFLVEGDLVAYQYVSWHAFVYSNLARLKPDIDGLVSAFDHDDTHHTGRADIEPAIRELKKWLDVLGNDSANTLADLYTAQIKVRAGQANEVTMTVTTAADKTKRATLETETRKVRGMQITVQGVLEHTNKFVRNATWEGVKYAGEAVKEFIEVRNKIVDTTGGPDYDDKSHLKAMRMTRAATSPRRSRKRNRSNPRLATTNRPATNQPTRSPPTKRRRRRGRTQGPVAMAAAVANGRVTARARCYKFRIGCPTPSAPMTASTSMGRR